MARENESNSEYILGERNKIKHGRQSKGMYASVREKLRMAYLEDFHDFSASNVANLIHCIVFTLVDHQACT